MLVLNHQRLGRGSSNNNPCLRSELKLHVESLDIFKAQLVGDLRTKATPFMSAKTLLEMRERRFFNQGGNRKKIAAMMFK